MAEKFTPIAFMPPHPGLRADSEIRDWLQSKSAIGENMTTWAIWAIQFAYSKGGKSYDTYNGIRGELERFILYLSKEGITPDQVSPLIVSDYMKFCQNPDDEWVMRYKAHRFDVYGRPNLEWRPFYLPVESKKVSCDRNHIKSGKKPKIIKKGFSQASLKRRFSFLRQWYDDLLFEGRVDRNPVERAIRNSELIFKSTDEKQPNTFTKDEWFLIANHLLDAANEDPKWERTFFVILLMKSCYLRLSDLCRRPYHEPLMSHFYQFKGYWFLRVISKGKKERSVTVPNALLDYLVRYRETRGLEGLPSPNEHWPLIAKDKGQGGVGTRQMSRIIKEGFSEVARRIRPDDEDTANKVEDAVTHILRHTGASIDAFWRPLPELAEELGHDDPATTGRLYVHSLREERAKRGSGRALF